MQIPIARPFIGEEEKQAVLEVLSQGQLSQGPKVAEFERAFAAAHGAKHGVATTNGTTALISALMAHRVGPGDEVIVPSFSFFATAACVVSVGARPVFADIDASTYCLSVEAVESVVTPRTRAVLAVHLYGLPADMPGLDALCRQRDILLLEDAAQAHGAAIGKRSVGTWGTAAFSFYPTKNMTTTEGGMVLTNDDEVARRLRLVRQHGMSAQYRHETIGYNFRMTDVAAAIGVVQLGRLSAWNAKRIENAAYFDRHLRNIRTPKSIAGYTHVYHQYTVRVPEGVDRDAVVQRLNNRGVGARVYYPAGIHEQPVFRANSDYAALRLPETAKATREVFSLPVHPGLTESEVETIVEEVNATC